MDWTFRQPYRMLASRLSRIRQLGCLISVKQQADCPTVAMHRIVPSVGLSTVYPFQVLVIRFLVYSQDNRGLVISLRPSCFVTSAGLSGHGYV